MTGKNQITRLPIWGIWLAPALLAFAPLFLRLGRFATCGTDCGAGSWLGLFSDAISGSAFLVLLLACPRALRWLLALFWMLCQVGSQELYQAMQRYPVWQDVHYLFDADFVRNSTGSFKLAAPLFSAVLFLAAIAASLVRLPRVRLRYFVWSVPTLAVLFFVHARLEAGSSHAVTANRNPLHNFVLDAAQGGTSGTATLPESLRRPDLSGAPLLGGAKGRAKNVLIVVVEGIPGLYIPEIRKKMGVDEYEVTMDKLDKSTQSAMLIPDFVAHSHQTIRGLYSILCGDFSKFSFDTPKPFELLGKPERAAACLPAQLRKHGFSTHFLQAAGLGFMAKDRVMAAIGFGEAHGMEWFAEQKISNPFPLLWGIVDAPFFQGAQRYISRLRKDAQQPWMLTLLTVGTHQPYGVSKAEAAEYRSPRDAAVALLDTAVADFLNKLKADGVLDDTLVIITSDESHGSPRWDWASSWGLGIVLAPEQEKLPRIKPGGYGLVDMEVSILDYLHLPVPAQVLGRSFFRSYDTPREMLSYTNGVLRMHTGNTGIRCAGGRTCTSFPAASILGQPPQEMKELPEQQSAETYALASALTDALRAGSDVQSFSFASGEQRKLPGMLIGGQYMVLPANTEVTVRVQMTLLEGSGKSVPFRIKLERDHDYRLDYLVDYVNLPPELPAGLPELQPGESMDETISFHNAIKHRNVSFTLRADDSKGLVRIDRFDVSIKKNPDSGVTPEPDPEPELSLLERAVRAGDAQQVRALLEQGIDVNAANKKGSTALMWAVQYERADIAEMLLNKGANPNAENRVGYIALRRASGKGDNGTVRLLLDKGADINQTNKWGETALMEAAFLGHVDTVKLLLGRGADLNAGGRILALGRAAAGGHADVVQLLIDKGAKVNAANDEGSTALVEAARHGHVEAARLLLERGADIHAVDKGGNTALARSAIGGHSEVVRLLLDKGANANAVNAGGWTPLMHAAENGRVDVVEVLLERGADGNAGDNWGNFALGRAAAKGYTDIARLLIDKGADVNQANKDGWTALMEAAHYGHPAAVKLLLEKGADVNAASKVGTTALLLAEQKKRVGIVEVLKAAGAKE